MKSRWIGPVSSTTIGQITDSCADAGAGTKHSDSEQSEIVADRVTVDIEGLREEIDAYSDNPLWEDLSLSQKLRRLIQGRLKKLSRTALSKRNHSCIKAATSDNPSRCDRSIVARQLRKRWANNPNESLDIGIVDRSVAIIVAVADKLTDRQMKLRDALGSIAKPRSMGTECWRFV